MIFIDYIVKSFFISSSNWLLDTFYLLTSVFIFLATLWSLVYCDLPVFYHCFIFFIDCIVNIFKIFIIWVCWSVQVMVDLQVISNHMCTTNTRHAPVFLSKVSFVKVSWNIRTVFQLHLLHKRKGNSSFDKSSWK